MSSIFSFKLLCFSFVLIVISKCSWAFKNANIYPKYYVEDSCTDNENITYELSQIGKYSVAKIGAFRFAGSRFGARNCSMIIKPPNGYSVYLEIESFSFDFSCAASSNCTSYIQVFGNGTKSHKLCGSHKLCLPFTSFTTYGNMTIVFHTRNDFLIVSSGFTLIATAFKASSECVDDIDYFSCKNGRCIWQDLTCDSINNCGDSSDEEAYGFSHCSFENDAFTLNPHDFNFDFTVPTPDIETFHSSHNISLGAAVASAIFVILGAFIRFYCYYQCNQANRRQILSAVTIIRARTILRQPAMNGTPPPPYETLVNDPEGHPESPPEYTAVNVPTPAAASSPCQTQNNATTNHPAADKNANVASDPPPPYEP